MWAPPEGGWTRVSHRLGRVRQLVLLAVATPLALLGAAVAAAVDGAAAAIAVLALAGAVAFAIAMVIDRQWRSIGYAERDDDLLVTRGVLFRQLVVVPFGRMQFVDVTTGPLERWFGLATVQLHTASAATDASIPGLVPSEAARLRDRLAALGEHRSAGL